MHFNTELKNLILQNAPLNQLPQETVNLLVAENPITPKLYILPKIHKGLNPPPGRPIVAGCGSSTERVSAYVDFYLQPLVQNLASHIKDTNDFLTKLSFIQQPLPENSILVTIDVTSLYTNIPHIHGLSATEQFLERRPKGTLPKTSFLISLTKFILEKNNFQFLDRHYLQLKGTAMGTKMAPSYANLYMGRLEEDFLKKQTLHPLCWYRYIDDIFMIWTQGQDSLDQFLNNLNSFSPLSFTWNSSNHSMNFLDVTIEIEKGYISTSVYMKPTNQQQYLHYNSCHPNNTKRSLPYSLALRGKRINSNEKHLKRYNTQLQTAFEARGYPSQIVKTQIKAAQQATERSGEVNKHTNPINLITTYHPGLHKLNTLLRTGYNMLKSASQTSGLLDKPPSIVYRQPPNLKAMLVHPKLPDPSVQQLHRPPPGSYPCDENRCKTCDIHPPSKTFTSTFHNREYKIKDHITCNSENLIYQLQCNQCEAQYIGLTTQTLRKRMNGHRQDVKTNKEKPIAIHAGEHNLDFDSCFTTKAIKSLPKSQCNSSVLRRWELAYQYITNSRSPPNLNIR